MKNLNRRNFIKKSSLTAASLYSAASLACSDEYEKTSSGGKYMGDFSAPKLETVRIAVIGVGARGSGHIKQFAAIEGTEIVGIADLYEDLVDNSVLSCKEIDSKRHQNIARYFGSEDQWKKMLVDIKPDAVIIATNWNNHAKMAIESM